MPKTAKGAPESVNECAPADSSPQDIKSLLAQLDACSEIVVDAMRFTMEDTPLGQDAIKKNPDRRLYAILKPTKKENLDRIANVIELCPPLCQEKLINTIYIVMQDEELGKLLKK